MKKLTVALGALVGTVFLTAGYILSPSNQVQPKLSYYESLPESLQVGDKDNLIGIGISPNGSTFVYDETTLKKDHENVTFLLLMMTENAVTSDGKVVEMIVSSEQVNCKTHQYKANATAALGVDGKVLSFKDSGFEWQPIPPTAILATKMENIVCGREIPKESAPTPMPRSRTQLDQQVTNI